MQSLVVDEGTQTHAQLQSGRYQSEHEVALRHSCMTSGSAVSHRHYTYIHTHSRRSTTRIVLAHRFFGASETRMYEGVMRWCDVTRCTPVRLASVRHWSNDHPSQVTTKKVRTSHGSTWQQLWPFHWHTLPLSPGQHGLQEDRREQRDCQ